MKFLADGPNKGFSRNRLTSTDKKSNSLVILNLPPQFLDRVNFKRHFSKYGKVMKITISAAKNSGTVQFDSHVNIYRSNLIICPIFSEPNLHFCLIFRIVQLQLSKMHLRNFPKVSNFSGASPPGNLWSRTHRHLKSPSPQKFRTSCRAWPNRVAM